MKTIKDIKVKGKRVLVRVDFNVPLDSFGRVLDDTKIIRTIPTIKYLLSQNAKIILLSHLGRPEGKIVEGLRLEPVGRHLSRLLEHHILILRDCLGQEVENKVNNMLEGDIALLENVRFHPEEKKNDPEFAKKLASLGDIFVMDAFGVAHRAHASVVGISKILPTVAGFLMDEEIRNLKEILEKPNHPSICLIGGAKISTKLEVINNLIKKVDKLLLGGAVVHTVLVAKGIDIGKSLIEEKMVSQAKKLLKFVNQGKLILPKDGIVSSSLEEKEITIRITDFQDIKKNEAIYDIGPETIDEYKEIIQNAKTIVWNGPMGFFEKPVFSKGTNEIAKAIALSEAKTVVGGGETLEVIRRLGLKTQISFISTGGGAMLEFLEGKELPGIKILK